ncbi:MAG: hypothetical protein LBK06_02080 [Planctomycetaceae bacterium]|jgi:hypothetical protein|nr:hypothetical protein [Planctomycetaceae bacterium]
MDNLGFITVIDHPQHGLIGGYLVLNQAGRPLEFHCTNPIKPSRTQEILFGISLEPYLYGEQIARTLVSKSKLSVVVILTNIVSILAVNGLVTLPIAYIFDKLTQNTDGQPEPDFLTNTTTTNSTSTNDLEVVVRPKLISEELNESLRSFGIEDSGLQTCKSTDDNEILTVPQVTGLDVEYWQGYKIGNRTVAIPGEKSDNREQLLGNIKKISRNVDLLEPFTRIKLAIAETHNYE